MNHNDNKYSIAGYSIIEELASGIIAAAGASFAAARKAQEEIASEDARKRAMRNQIHRDAIDRLPFELRYWSREPRI